MCRYTFSPRLGNILNYKKMFFTSCQQACISKHKKINKSTLSAWSIDVVFNNMNIFSQSCFNFKLKNIREAHFFMYAETVTNIKKCRVKFRCNETRNRTVH